MANLFFIGDSMIEFFDWQQRFPEHRAINLGRCGETTAELLARLPAILSQQPPPDWLLLMTGTNDVCMENFAFPADLTRIITTCRTQLPTTVITVNSLLPLSLPYLAANVVPRMNDILYDLTTKEGGGFLDGHAALTNSAGLPLPGVLAVDGVHLQEHGYQLWATEVEKHLLSALP